MRVGIDYRPALVTGEGIGRYPRELVRGLIEHNFGGNLGLFGYTLAGARFSRAISAAKRALLISSMPNVFSILRSTS